VVKAILPSVCAGAVIVALAECKPSATRGQGDLKTMPDLSFVVKATADQKTLTVGYRVVNSSGRDAYLLNRLYRSTPEWLMSPDVVFVDFDRAAAVARLSKRIPATPPGVNVTMPYTPFVSPVRANATFSEVIRLPLPLHEYKQFGNKPVPHGKEPEIVRFSHVILQVQYYWRPAGTTEETRDVQSTEVIVPRTPPGINLEFGFLDSGSVAVSFPAAVYD
jgi:hypothetical protein